MNTKTQTEELIEHYRKLIENETSPANLKYLLKITDDGRRFIYICVDRKDEHEFLCMCAANSCRYSDGTYIDPDNPVRCGHLMLISEDLKIEHVHGLRAMILNSLWHYNFSEIRQDLYLPRIKGCVNLAEFNTTNKNNYFMDSCNAIMLPENMMDNVKWIFKDVRIRDYFYIYFSGDYDQAKVLRSMIPVKKISENPDRIRIAIDGSDTKENMKHLYDEKGRFVERWIFNDNNKPVRLSEREIMNSVMLPGEKPSKYRNVYRCASIYTNNELWIGDTNYQNQMMLSDETVIIPRLEEHLSEKDIDKYIYIEQGEKPHQEKAYMIDLKKKIREYLGQVNYIDYYHRNVVPDKVNIDICSARKIYIPM